MSEPIPLREAVLALSSFDSPDELAAHFRLHGDVETGRAGNLPVDIRPDWNCPVQAHLRRATGREVYVGFHGVQATGGEGYDLPGVVRQFITNFDRRAYPDLREP